MTEAEILAKIKIKLNIDDTLSDAVLNEYVEDAKYVLLNRLYPFGIPDAASVPDRYIGNWTEIAIYLYDKNGASGEKEHTEGDVKRVYEAADVPPSMLARVVPCIGIPS